MNSPSSTGSRATGPHERQHHDTTRKESRLIELIVTIGVILLFVHLLGGAHGHRRHYKQHGLHPRLMNTYGRGWWGSVRIGGFRIGHRL
jgi:hypothetical protein